MIVPLPDLMRVQRFVVLQTHFVSCSSYLLAEKLCYNIKKKCFSDLEHYKLHYVKLHT